MSLCADCFKGVRHEGEPDGKFETIANIRSYVAVPEGEYDKSVVLLYLTDAFGIDLSNNQLLISDFAKNGFRTVAPDLFNGDPAPVDAFTPGSTFNIGEWFGKHGPPSSRPIVDAVVAALKAEGVTKFLVNGYCYGGRFSFDLAFEGVATVVAVSHPSLLQVPADLEKYKEVAKAPLLINSAPVDQQFPLEASEKADAILAGFAPGYKREHFEGCQHGFAVRGDLSNPQVKAGKEGAFKATVEWFQKHL